MNSSRMTPVQFAGARHAIESVTAAYFDERVAINLRPHCFATQAVLGSMRARGGGAIINMGSGSWKIKGSGYAVYATCKSAMLGLRKMEIADIPLSCRT